MKIVLTGCQGQVGWELVRCLLPLGEVICAGRAQVDLTDLEDLRSFVRQHTPDIIVNAAAYTAVDKAEKESEPAFLVNGKAPGVLAEEARKLGALLIHFSTDYVFDGIKQSAYCETDQTNPLNVYGQSKLAGEKAIQAVEGDYLIFRTSWVYAARGHNFVKTILRLATEREQLSIVADQIGSPTWARLIAETTAHALKQSISERLQGRFNSAVYNLTASGSTSWCDFSKTIIEFARQRGSSGIKNCIINPIPATDFPLPAKRPANSTLSTERLEKHFGIKMPAWEIALKLCLDEMLPAD